MKDVYVRTFRTLVREQEEKTGFSMPSDIELYCVHLLAERIDRTNLVPDPSFAERYFIMYADPRASEFKQFADDCLFFSSIVPEYAQRRGISLSYYVGLGVTCYNTCSDLTNEEIYRQVGTWFEPLRFFLENTIKNKPTESLLFK